MTDYIEYIFNLGKYAARMEDFNAEVERLEREYPQYFETDGIEETDKRSTYE
jgi:hypothetical protein